MNKQELIDIGKAVRDAAEGNLLIGSFAAELIGESYPLPKSMWDVVFKDRSDLELGSKFVKWHDGEKDE